MTMVMEDHHEQRHRIPNILWVINVAESSEFQEHKHLNVLI